MGLHYDRLDGCASPLGLKKVFLVLDNNRLRAILSGPLCCAGPLERPECDVDHRSAGWGLGLFSRVWVHKTGREIDAAKL